MKTIFLTLLSAEHIWWNFLFFVVLERSQDHKKIKFLMATQGCYYSYILDWQFFKGQKKKIWTENFVRNFEKYVRKFFRRIFVRRNF